MNFQPYTLTDLVKPTRQVGRFALVTAFNTTVLNYYSSKLTTREQYEIAQRAARLIAHGYSPDNAVFFAHSSQNDHFFGELALSFMFCKKEDIDITEYIVRHKFYAKVG